MLLKLPSHLPHVVDLPHLSFEQYVFFCFIPSSPLMVLSTPQTRPVITRYASKSMMNDSCYLAITFLSSHHKHLLLIISVSSTNSSSSSEVTMDTDPNPTLSVDSVESNLKDASSYAGK